MVFHPIMDKFKNFQQHTEHLEAHKAGIGKVNQLLYCLMILSSVLLRNLQHWPHRWLTGWC